MLTHQKVKSKETCDLHLGYPSLQADPTGAVTQQHCVARRMGRGMGCLWKPALLGVVSPGFMASPYRDVQSKGWKWNVSGSWFSAAARSGSRDFVRVAFPVILPQAPWRGM